MHKKFCSPVDQETQLGKQDASPIGQHEQLSGLIRLNWLKIGKRADAIRSVYERQHFRDPG